MNHKLLGMGGRTGHSSEKIVVNLHYHTTRLPIRQVPPSTPPRQKGSE